MVSDNHIPYYPIEKTLSYVSQEEIFSLAFGFIPQENVPYCSVFRPDRNPRCWFQKDHRGFLRFIDFANKEKYKGIRLSHMNCFDAVMVYFRLSDLVSTLRFIKQNLIDGKGVVPIERESESSSRPVLQEFRIIPHYRDFDGQDATFWKRLEISKNNLVEDYVRRVHSLTLLNTKKHKNVLYVPHTLGYSFEGFVSGRCKVYFPHKVKENRFLTDTDSDDIGGLVNLRESGDLLIIQKSYKDYRVVKNQGFEVIWFQSETLVPQEKILYDIVKRYTNVIVWFDNDSAGKKGSKNLVQVLNGLIPNKAVSFDIPLQYGVKDPSDFIVEKPSVYKYFIKKEFK